MKIYGPPGTGKTRALLDLLDRELAAGTELGRIAFLTFTRAARLEVLRRTAGQEFTFCRTIHSTCYRQLGVDRNQIVSPKDLREFGTTLGVKVTGATRDPWADEFEYTWEPPTKADLLLQLNHLGRHRQVKLKEALVGAPADLDYRYAKWFTEAYRRWKDQEMKLDYTDLLVEYLRRGEPLPVDVVFVDEAQDLSPLQWQVVDRLAGRASRVYLAGDDDQAIFAWAGASAETFMERPASETLILDRSHRLPRRVLETARTVSARISRRIDKAFGPRDEDGEVLDAGYLSEDLLQDESTFVLFRNHHRGSALARHLEDMAWPYAGNASPLSDPDTQQALRGWFKLCHGQPVDRKEAQALVKMSSQRWTVPGASQVAKYKTAVSWGDLFLQAPVESRFGATLHRLRKIPYLERCAVSFGWAKMFKPSVTLLSIHQSKGQQADTVVLDREMSRASWEHWMRDPDDEHRVWYVGVTRARKRLVSLLAGDPMSYPL